MIETKNSLDRKVNAYIDNLFAGIGASQQLFDLKEELATNMKERIADFMAREWMRSRLTKKQ